MPAYFFHLAFELYQHPEPSTASTPASPPAFLPPSNLDIFGPNLPVHKHSSWVSYIAPRRAHQRSRTGGFRQQIVPSPRRRSSSRSGTNPGLETDAPSTLGQECRSVESSETLHNPLHSSLRSGHTDYRFDKVLMESIDMNGRVDNPSGDDMSEPSLGGADVGPLSLKGRYVPSDPATTEFGWGVVHLYRDGIQSPELVDGSITAAGKTTSYASAEDGAFVDENCTTLCILAVPSYMTPADLLGWFGESTTDLVSHFRLVRTSRSNRYMVLMKFKESQTAKRWQQEWNGKLFNSMEPENCHVVFVKSIKFQTPEATKDPSSFPDMTNDPFTPAMKQATTTTSVSAAAAESSQNGTSLTTKPAPPPTPALVELPTCPVCLERMDETTGLATIFCQHVFHCACLQKWPGSACPVCRYTQHDPLHRSRPRAAEADEDQCRACGATDNLWICLICGHVGCGRYDDAHAFAHFEQTSHSFAMDLTTQVIWDYIGDEYVHRLIQSKADGKLVELPSTMTGNAAVQEGDSGVPKHKIENMSLEYTNLLKCQLDSQRYYFEEQVDRAVDKASQATTAADEATARALKATERLEVIESSNTTLLQETLPSLERDKERSERRAEKFETLARKMEKDWKEKEVINESLMDRIGHLERQVGELTLKNSDLEEQNRDLSFFISGMEKLKDRGSDVQEGTVEVGDAPAANKKKKGKSKK